GGDLPGPVPRGAAALRALRRDGPGARRLAGGRVGHARALLPRPPARAAGRGAAPRRDLPPVLRGRGRQPLPGLPRHARLPVRHAGRALPRRCVPARLIPYLDAGLGHYLLLTGGIVFFLGLLLGLIYVHEAQTHGPRAAEVL